MIALCQAELPHGDLAADDHHVIVVTVSAARPPKPEPLRPHGFGLQFVHLLFAFTRRDLATTIMFNLLARLRTAAWLRFNRFAIAATLAPDNAKDRMSSSSSSVQGGQSMASFHLQRPVAEAKSLDETKDLHLRPHFPSAPDRAQPKQTDKSEQHQDGSGYHQPMRILHR
jgi:hypothetical protein